MASRIFPTIASEMGSEKEFNGINLDTLAARIASIGDNGDKRFISPNLYLGEGGKGSELTPEVRSALAKVMSEGTPAAPRVKKAGEVPESFKSHQFKSKGDKSKDDKSKGEGFKGIEDEASDEDKDKNKDRNKSGEIVEGKKEASARSRRVVFSSREQINAEALEAAEAAGDTALYNTIMAARDAVRVADAKEHLRTIKAHIDREASVAKRQSIRISVVTNAAAAKKAVASGKAAMKTASQTGLKTASELSRAQKRAFAQRALAHGFDEEYISKFIGMDAPKVSLSQAETRIREVMSSELAMPVKKAAVEAMVRVATLSPEQVARQIDYWKNDLGYGDVEWINDLFKPKGQ